MSTRYAHKEKFGEEKNLEKGGEEKKKGASDTEKIGERGKAFKKLEEKKMK